MSANGTSPAPAAGRTEPTPAATEEAADRSRARRHRPRAAPPAVAPPRTRRRTGVLAAGVSLVALGALGAAYLAQTVGGTVAYVMTGPEGDEAKGFWRVTAVDAPHALEFDDLFGEPDAPAEDLPTTHAAVWISDTGSGTRMVMTSSFPSVEALDQLVEMGMLEGLRQAVGQIDALLAGATR